MPDETANLALPYLLPSQAQKHATLNEGLTRLDALVQLALKSRAVAAQPGSPAEGDRYILPASPSGGDWAGKAAGTIAHYRDGVWDFITPRAGFMGFLESEACLIWFNGAAWSLVEGALDELQNVPLFGLGGATDSATPFYAKLGKALFTAKLASEGGDGDLRMIINKETAADFASLLFQTAFSGRAEIGLTGDDDLSVKVSSDGAAWLTALKIAKATGVATFAYGACVPSLNGGPLAGFRNRLINGGFNVNQRVFAGGALSAGAYGFDRWKAGAGGANISLSGKTLSLTSGSILQIIEAPDLAGAQVTVSVGDLATRDLTVTIAASGSGSGSVSGDILQGGSRKGVTLTVPATATGNLSVEIAPKIGGSGVPTFKEVQLEPGSLATPFEFRPTAFERDLCERYYSKSFAAATAPTQNTGLNTGETTWVAAGSGASQALHEIVFPRRMRATPTVTLYNPAAANSLIRDRNASADTTSNATQNPNERSITVYGTTAAGHGAGGSVCVHWVAEAEL